MPLFWAWRGSTPRAAAFSGFVFGAAFLGSVMWGLHHVGYLGYLAAVVVVGAPFFAATGALVATLARRGVSSPLVTASIWVLLEGLRVRWPFGGLAWAEVGSAFHDVSPVRALASWGGVALVSFVVVAWNGFLLDLVLTPRADRRARLGALAGLLAAIVLVGVGSVGRVHTRATGTVRFAMLQAFVDEHAPTTSAAAEEHSTASHLALAGRLRGRYDLIVFPESALARDPEEDRVLRQALITVANRHGAVVLANARHRGDDGTLSNANLAYEPDGRLQGIYAKQHLVPYGEYVPLRSLFSFVGDLRQIPYDFEPGDRATLFEVAGHDVGSVICYESAYTGLVREFVRDGAELLVVSTSDRLFGRSGMAAQHFAMAQMRAAETGRPVLQAAVSGVSGVIDADGKARDLSGLFEETITEGRVSTRTGSTPFVRFGDWTLVASAIVVLGGTVVGVRRRSRAS